MAKFILKCRQKEAIKENTETLLSHFKKGEVTVSELLELEQMAIEEEEYEIAQSVKAVLDYAKENKQHNGE